MKFVVAAIAAGVMAGALMSAPAMAASKMQACAAQWQQMKASGQDKGTTYKAFSATCMKGAAAPAPAVTAPAKPSKKTVAVAMPVKPAPAAPVVPVAAKGQTKMQMCAANWQSLKASGKTNGQDYKTYSASCMKGGATVAMAPTVANVSKPAAAVVPTGGKMSQQDRMKACAANWDKMKAAGQTKNTTYKAYSSQCLKSH